MNNPIQTLLEEHGIIVSGTDLAKDAGKLLARNETEKYEQLVRKLISFFRLYADQYHHYKEERILFPEMSDKNELLEGGVIHEMFQNHEDFREMVKCVEQFLDAKEYLKAQAQLNIYIEALLDHIAVENDEVFQMAESLFNPGELEKMYFRFEDCDVEINELNKTARHPDKAALAAELQDLRNLYLAENEVI
jgi:hemerythrin-like domain-containing protein